MTRATHWRAGSASVGEFSRAPGGCAGRSGRFARPHTTRHGPLRHVKALQHPVHQGNCAKDDGRQRAVFGIRPGLMPGTGLARDRSVAQRFGWTYVLPVLRLVMRGVSSAERSADTYAKLLHTTASDFASGAYVDFRLREIAPSEDATRSDLAQDLYRVSARLSQVDLTGHSLAPDGARSAGLTTSD